MTIRPSIFRWKPAAWLKIEGTDAFTFLQGQFTNDLRELDHHAAVYGLWLNQKGKVLADSFVLRGKEKDTVWVGSYFSPAELIKERLESYIIADDVIITNETEAWVGMTLFGSENVSELTAGEGAFRFPGRRDRGEHWEWVTRTPVAMIGADELTATDLEQKRIKAGIPAVPADIGPGELPNEGNLDVGGISYTKGCYLGQEVMARLKNLGQVRRQLMRVSGEGPPPATLAELFQHGKKMGVLRSVVTDQSGFVGLALLTTMQLDRNLRLSLAPDGPGLVELVPSA